MRNLRCWHKNERRFVCLRSIDFESETIGYDAQGEMNYYDTASFADVVIQESTGRIDMNGKEVYEGDVVTGRIGSQAEMKAWLMVYDPVNGYGDWDQSTMQVIGHKFSLECRFCHKGIVEKSSANEPWADEHWACPECDSTYNTSEYPQKEKR